eukprot:140336-Karenia_brevis.AAC.1
MNLEPEDGDRVHLQGPAAFGALNPGGRRQRSEDDDLRQVLGSSTELHDQAPTHFDHKNLVEQRLDRIFVSLPMWALRQLTVRMGTGSNPQF